MFARPFSVDTNTLPASFQMEFIKLQSDIQLKNLIMSLYQTFIIPVLARKNTLCFTITPYKCHHFFWQYMCFEQLLSCMKDRSVMVL